MKLSMLKIKAISAKAGIHLNIEKTKIINNYTTLKMTMKKLKLLKILYSLTSSSTKREVATKKSEGA